MKNHQKNSSDLDTQNQPAKNEDSSSAEAIRDVFQTLVTTPEAEKRRLYKILNLIPNYIVLLNQEGKILFKNKAFDDFFGNKSCDTCYEVMKGYNKKCKSCPPLDALASQSSCITEWLSLSNQQAFRVYCYPFEESKDNWLMLKVGINITGYLKVQQALDLRASSYKVITDSLAIGISLLTPSLTITAGNNRLVQWFGSAIAPGVRICDILCCKGKKNPSEKGTYCPDCPFHMAMLDGSTHEKEFRVSFIDGSSRSVRLVACPVRPKKGKVKGFVLMLEDITKRLKISKQIQKIRKLEAMGTLAAGIAHEINQPLSALHLYASGMQMMLEKNEGIDVPFAMKRMDLIMDAAEKIRSIIANMRALVLNETPTDLCPIDLNKAIESALILLEKQLTLRKITIKFEPLPSLPLILGNNVQMEQIMINLLTNAMHAIDAKQQKNNDSGKGSDNNGVIHIRTIIQDNESNIGLSIADSGIGLPKAPERVFDPFFTTREGNEGMGLGLSIVHGLVRQWGGEISAKAHCKELGGAKFYLTLNAYAPEKEIV